MKMEKNEHFFACGISEIKLLLWLGQLNRKPHFEKSCFEKSFCISRGQKKINK